MANPGMIGGGRYTRFERSGDKRNLQVKKIDAWPLLKRIWKYLGKNRLLLILALVLSVTSSLLSLYGPKLSGKAINAIDVAPGTVDFETVFSCATLMAVCYILSGILGFLLHLVMVRLSKMVTKQMRHDIFQSMARLPVSYFDRFQTGDIISTVTYDVDTVNQSLSSDLLQILQSVITVVVSLIMMLTIAPKLVLIFLFTIPLTFLTTRLITVRVRPLFRRRSAALGRLNGFVEEMLSGQKTVRAYGQEKAVLEQFDRRNQEAVDAYTKAEANGTITGPSVNFINNLSLALVCVFGSTLFLKGPENRREYWTKLLRSPKPICPFRNSVEPNTQTSARERLLIKFTDGPVMVPLASALV